ncbi:MAG: DUF167 family protein [Deferrisomatales bacterium]|nr:DUF167 family protein [Deferrisomatales bacterium]
MPVEAAGDGCRLRLWVQPRAARDEVAGVQGDAVKVRLTAPPVEGKANGALVRFLARQLGVPRGAVELTAGAGSRHKTVRVSGLSPQQARERLGL